MQPLPPQNPYEAPVAAVSSAGKPDNNLILAIFSTLCCCVPTGIAAIVYAAQVDGKWAGGDFIGAQKAAEESKKWSFISIGLGVVFTAIYILAGFASA